MFYFRSPLSVFGYLMRVHCSNDADIFGQTTSVPGVRVGENPTIATTPTRRLEHVENDYYNNVSFSSFPAFYFGRSIIRFVCATAVAMKTILACYCVLPPTSNVIMYRRCLAIDNALTPSPSRSVSHKRNTLPARIRRRDKHICSDEVSYGTPSNVFSSYCDGQRVVVVVPFTYFMNAVRETANVYFIVALEMHGVLSVANTRETSSVPRGSFRNLKIFVRSFARHTHTATHSYVI